MLKNKIISVAPMMDWTTRHCRYFMRLLNQSIILYTEMVTTGAIFHGNHEKLLQYRPEEHPLVVQLGGSDPQELAQTACICEQRGFHEINLNVGCPSDRVQRGMIGACLMAHPGLVAEGIEAMKRRVAVPVTVKTRIGIDEQDSYAFLCDFVSQIAAAGCDTLIIHARKAWLKGLSPKENRKVPELMYERVYQLKQDFPTLTIILNGGVTTVSEVIAHCQQVDGVMIGRGAYTNPQLLCDIGEVFSPQLASLSLGEVIECYMKYCQEELSAGVALTSLIKPLLGLFQGMPGARAWRRHLSEQSHFPGVGVDVIAQGAEYVLG